MLGCLILLLVIWLAIAVIGLAIKGLFWLFFVGLILFLITSAAGWFRRKL
jgi:hypothetical protein